MFVKLEEKTIDLEGTRAQLRIIETKSRQNLQHQQHQQQHHKSDQNFSPERFGSPASRDSITTINASQVSTPSMKAMTPLVMDELHQNHNSSSTESAHDQTELEHSRQETPRKRPPSKIPLPGTKGYLAPKPPTGRSTITSTTLSITQRNSPSGPPSNRSLSKSTGSLFGRSGPNSVTKAIQSPSLHRPDSAQSLRKDSSSLSNCSRSSSSIPVSSSTKSPSRPTITNNSPIPKPKRESLTSRVRNMDSLTRIQNNSVGMPPANPSPAISYSSNLYKSTSKKDLSSSFSTGQTRDRKQAVVAVRRVSSASVGRAIENSAAASGDVDNGKVPNFRTRLWNMLKI